jgi:hypothetical protein
VPDEDRRPDPVQQLGEPRLLERVRRREVARHRPGAGDELVERRLVRPLGVALVVGREQPVRRLIGERRAHLAEGVRMERRAPVARAVDDVHGVARLHQVGGPARAAVGRPQPVGALAAAAVDEHDRERAALLHRSLPLDVHLPPGDRAVGLGRALDADPEEAAPQGDRLGVAHQEPVSSGSR